MAIYDTYSRRKRLAEKGEPDVFVYASVPDTLRGQVQIILKGAIGKYNNNGWHFIRKLLCRELGKITLSGQEDPLSDCLIYLNNQSKVDHWLDLVEICCVFVDRGLREALESRLREFGIEQKAEDAIGELNERFRRAAFGYRYEAGKIIRVDNELLHAEVVKPALHFLADDRFTGPREEFLSAHAHYRAGEYKDAITDANNAFESTMKAICDLKGWEYPAGGSASHLLKVIRDNKLLPDYLDQSFDQLAATLKSGLPQVRNEEGSHGQGAEPKQTPGYIAGYALHLAAAKIVLLFEAFKDSEQQDQGHPEPGPR